jgi:hypothetical protein
MPEGLIWEATAQGISSCSGSSCSAGVLEFEPVGLDGQALAAEQPADDADGLVLPVAEEHRIDPERVGVRRQGPRPGAEDRASPGHVIELDHPLRHVEGMVIGEGHHAGCELDALRALARRGEEHLGRGDHLPAARVVLAAPEFVVPEPVQVLHQFEIAAELQHRVLPDRMVGGEEGPEVQTWHEQISWLVTWNRDRTPTESAPSLRPRVPSLDEAGPCRRGPAFCGIVGGRLLARPLAQRAAGNPGPEERRP